MINQAAKSGKRRYVFLKSKSGETVPSLALSEGNALPLHSLVDPKREAQRLVSTISEDTGFIIFLGLGGGFAPEAALKKTSVQVIVIDFHKDSITELLSSGNYSALLNNEHFCLLTDPSCEEIKKTILENYNPSLCGSIRTIPLRTRTELDAKLFENAAAAIQEAIAVISSDYSVQAHFGIRWFSNIICNVKNINLITEGFNKEFFASNVTEAAIVAAGPSLDQQIQTLAEYKQRGAFIISSDTALPVLLQHDIKPDAAVSIDCQHISYYHFMGCNTQTLVLDIASPPLLLRFSPSPVFFSGGHPLARYISAVWQPLPLLDTSGGNVTYACLSLAEHLGANRITLFGADFSYVESKTYARGTYIFPFFEKKQNRFSPAEALFSAFLYRSPFFTKENHEQNYHETASLRFYRKKLEEKAAIMNAEITVVMGQGAPIELSRKIPDTVKKTEAFTSVIPAVNKSGIEFLEQYRSDIAALPVCDCENYFSVLNVKDRQIFTTLLPCLAALKHRKAAFKTKDLIEETKRFCIQKITSVLIKQTP